MEVTEHTEALWETAAMETMITDLTTGQPAYVIRNGVARPARTVGLARVREIQESAANRAIAKWADEQLYRNRQQAASDRYYSQTSGGDWPEDH
jgi:hypothetical protein